jgi:hypothetical protein
MLRPERRVGNGGKDHVKHNGKKPKLTFAELLAKYQKDNEANRANRSNDVKYSRLPPRHNYGNWNRQRQSFYSATTYAPFEPSMPVSYAPYPTSVHPYSSWGGVIDGHILLHISDHIMLSMQLQDDHHVQGSHMLKVTVLGIKIGLVLKTRKRLSSKFTK